MDAMQWKKAWGKRSVISAWIFIQIKRRDAVISCKKDITASLLYYFFIFISKQLCCEEATGISDSCLSSEEYVSYDDLPKATYHLLTVSNAIGCASVTASLKACTSSAVASVSVVSVSCAAKPVKAPAASGSATYFA